MTRLTRIWLTATAILFAGQAIAVPIAEVGDAGETLATAQTVGAGTTSINGGIAGGADLFQFGWGGGAFSADTLGSGTDTQLFLFDAFGVGVWANDDHFGLLSEITDAALSAGTYYIGISSFDYDPRDAGNNLMFPSFPFGSQFGPIDGDALDHWSGPSFTAFEYSINFNSETTSVPEPGTLLLLGAGLLGLGLRRRRIAR